jgi:hypothetical protein
VVLGAGVRFVSEIGHVEEPSAAVRGVEDLLLEYRVALVEDAVDEREAFEGHDLVARLAQALGHGRHVHVDVIARVGREVEDRLHVLHNGRLQLQRDVARHLLYV